jgi:hypothetical protein
LEIIMREWNRSTREISPDQIPTEMASAIEAHLEIYNQGPLLEETLICIETVSEKVTKGLFGSGDRRVVTCAIVTPDWPLWSVSGDKSGAAALSARLEDLQITDYANTPSYRLPDTGLELTGELTGRTGEHGDRLVSTFIGLGEEPAAEKFRETLERERWKGRR